MRITKDIPARGSFLSLLPALASACVVLAAVTRPAVCQQWPGDFSDAGLMFNIRIDANGHRTVSARVTGPLGDAGFTLDEKQAAAVLGDPNAGIEKDLTPLKKLYAAHVQQSFGATDEEWKVLAPRVEKVRRLKLLLGSRGRFGGAPGAGRTELQNAWAALAAALEKSQTQMADVKRALQAVNDAEAAAKAELLQAQKDLKELLTIRQEAMLVRIGWLD
jgi:hypothetical protein